VTVALWMPGAVRKPITYRADAGKFPHTPLGWILHVQDGNGSPWSMFEHAPDGDRKFSSFWVSKSGTVEQYTETDGISWAQEAGNPDYRSTETEGLPSEPLTAPQIVSLGRLHAFLECPDELASKPGERGIGTHYMGGVAWGNHSCPDPVPGAGPRSHQRSAIIAASHPAPPIPFGGESMITLIEVTEDKKRYSTNGLQRYGILSREHQGVLLNLMGPNHHNQPGRTLAVYPVSRASVDAGQYGILEGPDGVAI
jgi:hypothetical protein